MKLTKTDFASFQACSKSFWLRKRRPDAIVWAPPSPMQRTHMMEGQEVERQSRTFLEANFGAGLIEQRTIATDTLLARADFIREHEDGSIDIFEVKASTKLKVGRDDRHLVDAAFQYLTATRAGYSVASIHVVHLDGAYERGDELDRLQLFKAVDVTAAVIAKLAELEREIDEAAALLATEEIDLSGCDCRFVGVNARCEAFHFFNPDVAPESAHYLPRITPGRLEKWAPTFDLRTVDPVDLNDGHRTIQQSLLSGRPVIDAAAIRAFLRSVEYPIYFYDYETSGPALPPVRGYRPFQAIPVQFSLHRLEADGTLHHDEWLADGHGQERLLIERLEACVGGAGSAMAWHKSEDQRAIGTPFVG